MYGESANARSRLTLVEGLSPRVRGIRLYHTIRAWRHGSIPACTGNPGLWCRLPGIPRVYPRVYGESGFKELQLRADEGLSPRVRGILLHVPAGRRQRRSIPACTGNPSWTAPTTAYGRVYPRVYGESQTRKPVAMGIQGLSPRVRGILPDAVADWWWSRSIPACTGNPPATRFDSRTSTVYPRVYGESTVQPLAIRPSPGLSPRVRGIRAAASPDHRHGGSIPACTGNPSTSRSRRWSAAVYPRVYGESYPNNSQGNRGRGLSPRVRGIRRPTSTSPGNPGSIPACTGNPPARCTAVRRCRVYPRVYGESLGDRLAARRRTGLSPRVRGIHSGRRVCRRCCGSIPACTGNPRAGTFSAVGSWVYPRVYGESLSWSASALYHVGLSPRVRGIRTGRSTPGRSAGSIPACTGNPPQDRERLQAERVYPRVYGESLQRIGNAVTNAGLSPRVRGIRYAPQIPGHRRGSIPACTGNPSVPGRWPRRGWVYPRVYGESPPTGSTGGEVVGLSPRVRGIHQGAGAHRIGRRSIPACTGNPIDQVIFALATEVYPRVYGESTPDPDGRPNAQGLSPRVRGIPEIVRGAMGEPGSIPACTGNPYPARQSRPRRRVYPRVYGESLEARRRADRGTGLSPRVRGIR